MGESSTSEKDLNDLSKFCVTAGAGNVIFEEGDAADAAFIIEHGQVELAGLSGSARVAILNRGDVFGEEALFGEGPREMTARAVTNCQVIRIDRSTFERLVQEDPLIGVGMSRRLAAYVREQRAALAQPAGGDAPTKVSNGRKPRERKPAALPPVQIKIVLNKTGREFVLAEKDATIGRTDHKTGRAPDIDLGPVDDERTISRLHARVLFKNGRFYLREEPGVRNGTFVNGRQLAEGLEVELVDGCTLRFGAIEAAVACRPARQK